jgi:O-acetyl-ADP-ribose deacetylase (regulator of RNase III)
VNRHGQSLAMRSGGGVGREAYTAIVNGAASRWLAGEGVAATLAECGCSGSFSSPRRSGRVLLPELKARARSGI